MRNLLALIGLLVVAFAVIGWYCGWYTISVNREPDGNLHIKTTVDTDKASAETSAFFKKVGEMVGERGERNQQPARQNDQVDSEKKDASEGGWFFGPSKPANTGR
jgi:hypothetical protein